jgi:hypothetical protein
MNRVRHLFLRANRWEMCLLFFIVCVVAPFVVPIAMISAAPSPAGISREQVLGNGLLAVATEGVFLLWLWSIGSFLRSVVPPDLRPTESFFRVAIICPIFFTFAGLALIFSKNSWPIAVTVTAGIFAFFCLLYDFSFVARTLYLAEKGEPPMMGEISGTVLQLWFFPVGAWFIQPRVNRLYTERGASGLSVQ